MSSETRTINWQAELTDTFGGEANYSWVNRQEFTLPADTKGPQIIKAAKAALGLTGVRCTATDQGGYIRLKPHGSLTVAFITPLL